VNADPAACAADRTDKIDGADRREEGQRGLEAGRAAENAGQRL